MSQKKFDKRIAFIKQALNEKLTDNSVLANEFYINHKCHKVGNTEALKRFKAWLP